MPIVEAGIVEFVLYLAPFFECGETKLFFSTLWTGSNLSEVLLGCLLFSAFYSNFS
jgi:hypothetical protein